jgi:hypothetical protein
LRYVAEAGENAVAVVDLDQRTVKGFIPTAWYPAAVNATPDGKRLVVTNTNASGAGPNPCGGLTPSVVPFGDPGAPTNPATAALAKASARWDFKHADVTPEIALNRAIWKSVKGKHSRMPKPRHVRIVGSRPNDESEG